jgi:outer membrane protein insertion porin family
VRLATYLAVALLAASLANAQVAPEALGLIVGHIRFEAPSAVDRRDYLQELPVRVGQPLSREALDESVRWLQEKKIFAAVNVLATAQDDRADVTFHLEPLPFVIAVGASGETAVDEETLLRSARIREDEPLTPEKIEAAKRRVASLYAERGYRRTKVEVDERVECPGQIRVTIRVEEGTATKVGAIVFEGIPSGLESDARRALGLKPGDVAAVDVLSTGRKALLRFLRGRGFYQAEVVASESISESLCSLRYQIHLGPRFAVEVSGNRSIPTAELLGLTDLANRPIVTGGTWRMMAQRMEEHYQEQGFAFAKVRVVTSGEDPRRVDFDVHEGGRVYVRAILFRGNHVLSDRELLRVIHTESKPWMRFPGAARGIFRRDVIADDAEQILERYRSEGYLQAEVTDLQTEFSQDQRWVTVTITISEGMQTRVASVEVTGADVAFAERHAELALESGRPFRPGALETDRRALLVQLAARGFVDAKVVAHVTHVGTEQGPDMVNVQYRIEPGEQVRIGRVLIQGNYYTRDSVIRRALPFASGDPLDPSKLSAAQTDIYRLGLFRSVAVHPLEQSGAVRDVAIEVGERPGGEFLYGIGYDTRAGLRNFVQIGNRNVWGTGDQVALRGDVNFDSASFVPDEYIASLDGKQPRFRGSRYDLRGNITGLQSERSIDEFSIRKLSVGAGFEREFLPGLRGSLMQEFEDSDTYDVAPDAVLTGQDVGRLRTVTLNPILLYDGRDDAFAPKRGVFDSLQLRYGSPALGSQVHFFKIIVQHSQFVPLGAGFTWLYGGRFGFAEPMGFTHTINLGERFFLGGRTSVRGYKENSIGPRGSDGSPTGGDLFVNGSTEIRFPLFFGLQGAAFVDGGGLYLVHGNAASGDHFRVGIGPGLRYQTPIGSIGLDYGFKVARRGNESIGRFDFTIGNIF